MVPGPVIASIARVTGSATAAGSAGDQDLSGSDALQRRLGDRVEFVRIGEQHRNAECSPELAGRHCVRPVPCGCDDDGVLGRASLDAVEGGDAVGDDDGGLLSTGTGQPLRDEAGVCKLLIDAGRNGSLAAQDVDRRTARH